MARRFVPEVNKSLVFAVILLLPGVSAAIFWVGMDSLTLLLLALLVWALLSRSMPFSFLLSVLLSLQHFEISILALGILFLALLFDKRKILLKLVGASLVVMTSSRLLFEITLSQASIEYKNRLAWAESRTLESLEMLFSNFPIFAYSAFGAVWILLFTQGFRFALPLTFAVPIALAIFPVAASFDQTRTFAIITFPVLLFFLLTTNSFFERALVNFGLRGVLLLSLIPIVVVWEGRVYSSLFFQNIIFLLDRVFSLGIVPEDPSLWPFLG